ncbi:MAG: MerR family transcriptional regulator [Marinibacterium sp.]
MEKSPDAFRTISEVADWLGIQAHVLRFWESKFSQVKPVKRAGGRRYYRPADMLLLGGIKKLLHEDGMTIKGVQKILREQGIAHVADMSRPLGEPAAASEAASDIRKRPSVMIPRVVGTDDPPAERPPRPVGTRGLTLSAPTPAADPMPDPVEPAPSAEISSRPAPAETAPARLASASEPTTDLSAKKDADQTDLPAEPSPFIPRFRHHAPADTPTEVPADDPASAAPSPAPAPEADTPTPTPPAETARKAAIVDAPDPPAEDTFEVEPGLLRLLARVSSLPPSVLPELTSVYSDLTNWHAAHANRHRAQ